MYFQIPFEIQVKDDRGKLSLQRMPRSYSEFSFLSFPLLREEERERKIPSKKKNFFQRTKLHL